MTVITISAEEICQLPQAMALAFLGFMGPFVLGVIIYTWLTKSSDRAADKFLIPSIICTVGFVACLLLFLGIVSIEVVP